MEFQWNFSGRDSEPVGREEIIEPPKRFGNILTKGAYPRTAAVGDTEYVFKHALTQEVSYNSILAERRRSIHERAARAIEALYAAQLEDHYSELAYHYLRGDDASEAIRYARLAADQAVGRGAYPEAVTMVEATLGLLDRSPNEAERLRAEFGLRDIESTKAFVLYG